MTRFAALGDSITLGVGDPIRRSARAADGRAWRGWAALLADGLRDPELHILAGNGATVADIEHDQLPRALAIKPDIASVVFGINDTLRSSFDPEQIMAATGRIVGALRASGAQVLTMRLPDAGQMLRLPKSLATPLARRTQAVNAALDAAAERFGTLHFDAAGSAAAYDRQMWAVDRLHPNERGHRLIARSFHSLLADVGLPVAEPPAAEPVNRPPGRLAQFTWMATKGTAWVVKRSTDMVPYLLTLAAHELLGTGSGAQTAATVPSANGDPDHDLGLGHDQDPVTV